MIDRQSEINTAFAEKIPFIPLHEPGSDPFGNEKPKEEPWTRGRCLRTALEAVSRDRQRDYGAPEDNFAQIANLWTTYLVKSKALNVPLEPVDIAAMMVLLKVARMMGNPAHADNWVDLAGYAACGCELACNGLGDN